jgi:3-oxoacyl-(acyl-carrier-protein) synthase
MIQTPAVAITGMGSLTAIGTDVAMQQWALQEGLHGIQPITRLSTSHQGTKLAGEVRISDDELHLRLELDPSKGYSRTVLLGLWALREALNQIHYDHLDGFRTALFSATTVGGMDLTETYYHRYATEKELRHFIASHPGGHGTTQLAQLTNIHGPVSTISTACSSGANAIMLGARMIKAGLIDRAIVGGVDSLSKFTINGFHSLMIYSDRHCMPFDAHRDGLNLGEGAAFLVLESQKVLEAQPKPILAYLSGYGNANDAFHQTASSDQGDGAYLAMQEALRIANLAAENIDYINAHGTATPNNDLSEAAAFMRLYQQLEAIPPTSSTKAFTGHTLAAAGAIEAVFSVIALQQQALLPNLHHYTPIEEVPLIPQIHWQAASLRHVLSNSLGFGGNCSTLVFSAAS